MSSERVITVGVTTVAVVVVVGVVTVCRTTMVTIAV